MARYLIVKVKDNSDLPGSTFSRVCKALHEFSGVSDMGVHGASPLTASERRSVVEAFESGMSRAKAAQKAAEEEKALTPVGYRWVSCSVEVDWSVGQYRHLKKYALDLLCGASASHSEVWRRNLVKEKCPRCIALSRGLP